MKIAHAFGRNPHYRDDGFRRGDDRNGTLLGNSDNPVICRHVHGDQLEMMA